MGREAVDKTHRQREARQTGLRSQWMLSFFTEKYDQYFGCLRGSKAKGVPSDELRKFLMISQLLDIVDGTRAGNLNPQLGTQARM
jgi:hypothetical protein